ncbi:MAG: PorT family protein [Leadbetterella sp.]|nr:PorT family protein [Leadbetterella sp.]
MMFKDTDGRVTEGLGIKPGFHIGGTVEIPVSDMFYVEPGLLFSNKGVKLDRDELLEIGGGYFTVRNKGSFDLYYLDIPLNGKVKFDVGSSVKVYGTFGPYVGVGVAGKLKGKLTVSVPAPFSESYDEKIEWGSDRDTDNFKRADFGLSIGGGAEFGPFTAGVAYNHGLANISSYTGEGTKINNRVFSISVGYRFGDN